MFEDKNIALKGRGRKYFKPLNYEPNEYSNTYPNSAVDHEIVAILQDKPSTFLQLKPFFPNCEDSLRMRLIDLCSKGVLRQVYNGNLYYQLKRDPLITSRPQIIIKKGLSEKVFDLSVSPINTKVEIPKGYSRQEYKREKLEIPKAIRLSFIDGKFRNPTLQD